MTRQARRLTELNVRNARWTGKTHPSGRPRLDILSDGDGLFLAVGPTSKAWVLRLHVNGKERRCGLGVYSDTGAFRASGCVD